MNSPIIWGRNPFDKFDLLWKNFFNSGMFEPFNTLDVKLTHPVDIYETVEGLTIDMAVVGQTSDDIKVEVDDDILKVSYDRRDDKPEPDTMEPYFHWVHRGISRRSVNLGWKISDRYDMNRLAANAENGLLTIKIPLREEEKPKPKRVIPIGKNCFGGCKG